MMDNEWQESLDEVMDWFDFNKISRVMQLLNWQWFGEGVPNESDIRRAVRRSLTKLIESDNKMSATGGFEYRLWRDTKDISVKFVAADWETSRGEL